MDYFLDIAAPAIAHNDLLILSLLATGFVVILGAMMTPVVLALTRPVHQTVERLARRAAWNACRACLARAMRWVIAIATAGVALVLVVAVIATPVHASPSREPAQKVSSYAIERMIGVLDKVAKHPVVQGASIIARGYTAVKVYRLSKEVKVFKTDLAVLHAAVHAILTEVTGVIARIEAGEALSAAEFAAVNARIDLHAVQIAAAEAEIEALKLRMTLHERRQRETDNALARHERRMGRDSKAPNLFFDPKCRCHRDARERAGAGGGGAMSAGM